MRACTIWWLVLLAGCSASEERAEDEADSDFVPPQITQIGVDEDAETPRFGGQAEETEKEMIDDMAEDAGWTRTAMGPARLVPRGDDDAGDAGAGKAKPKPVKTWKRSQLVPHTTKLAVGDKEELPLQAMQVNVRIDGFRARVVLDCVYENDRGEQLEGTFRIRLPNGATPFYMGFGATHKKRMILATAGAGDIGSIRSARKEAWTAPKEARMVPKEKAALAYSETVRRKIDPALLEWAGAGTFRAHVFPLEPKKLHRVVLGYELNLLPVGEDLEYRLDLPEKIPELAIDISVDGKPHASRRNPAERTFRVRVKKPGAILLRGKDAEAGDFFAAFLRPDLPAERAKPAKRAVFLVDVSLSSNPERFGVWLQLMEAILKRNRPALEEFTVLFFNVATFWWQDVFVLNNDHNVRRLRDYSRGLALEGATDVGHALAVAAQAQTGPYDLFLLSDGAATWGESDLHAVAAKLGKEHTLFAYDTGFSGTDKRMLGHLARETGGGVFSVVGEAEIGKAAIAHTNRPWRLNAVRMDGGDDLLLAGRPTTLFAGQTLYLAGRGRPEGDVVFSLERGSEKRELRTRIDRTVDSDLAPGVYGQIAVGQLEDFGVATEQISQAYALHFRVVGRTCSLLMLETEDDYKRFDIKPKENAYVIANHPAAKVVTDTLAAIGSRLGDPKRAFTAWFRRLAKLPGFEFEPDAALTTALEKMPAESFRVAPDALRTRQRTWKGIPGAVQEQLASRSLTYDSITSEARRRREKISVGDGLLALSSLVEHSPGDTALARDVGYTALEWGRGGQAYGLFRRVAHRRPHEPQTYHAMAQCLTELKRLDLALLCYEIAYTADWDNRFGDFREIVGFDYARFLRGIAGNRTCSVPGFARARLATLTEDIVFEQIDLVVTILWNTDRTDVDLHVVDPNNEECFYKHKKTKIGGRITKDVTEGYGPEMFLLPYAIKGKYTVKVKYFSTDQQRASARTRVFVTVYENWGARNERVTRTVATLAHGQEMHEVAVVTR